MDKKKGNVWAIPAKIAGEGIAYRHARYLALLDTPFEGGITVPAILQITAQKFKENPFLGTRTLLEVEFEKNSAGQTFEKLTLGDYTWKSFQEVFDLVCNFSSGLLSLGHPAGSRVAIFAETREEWFIGLQAALRNNLTVVTVYASLGEEALVHSLNETEVSTIIVDSKQLVKLISVADKLKTVKRVIYMEEPQAVGAAPAGLPKGIEGVTWTVRSFQEVLQLVAGEALKEPSLPKPSDTAVIMYTSGSTGVPKGVMMSHANLVATVAAVISMVPQAGPTDTYLAYLPLAHVLELAAEVGMATLGARVGYGSPLTLIDSSNKVKKGTKGDAPTLSPTLLAAVPAILDRIRDGVRNKVDATGGFAKQLFEFAYERKLAALEGRSSTVTSLECVLWDNLVFHKARAAVGGKLRFLLSGGAPLSSDTQRFMNVCFGCPVGQGYGLTETCAGGTFTEWLDTSVGRVGPPIPCNYVKLIDWEEGNYRTTDSPLPRGEICIGGPNVTQGYFNNPAKTAEDYHVDELGVRWFHTGDIGQFYPDGALEIIDRKKDIVKLQAGEYVSLGKVEAALQVCPFVSNIMLHADPSRSYAVALVVPHREAIVKFAQSTPGLESIEGSELYEKKEVVDAVLAAIAKEGKAAKLEKFEVPRKIKLLTEPWTPESGLVTAALKLKREQVRKTFAQELIDLYS